MATIRNATNKADLISAMNEENQINTIRRKFNKLSETFEAQVISNWENRGEGIVVIKDSHSPPRDWYLVRIRALDEADSMTLSPFELKLTQNEIYRRVNDHRQAMRLKLESNKSPVYGSIWRCRYAGKNYTPPIILEQFLRDEKEPKPQANLQVDGTTIPLSAKDPKPAVKTVAEIKAETATTSFPVTEGDGWSAKSGVKLVNELELNFITLLVERLKNKGFTKGLVVTSLTRTASQQIGAIISQVKEDPTWFNNKYKANAFKPYRSVIKAELDKGEANWSPSKMEQEVKNAMQEGIYMSKHLRSGAFDIRTKDFDYTTAKVVIDEVKLMKKEKVGAVTFAAWEKVEDNKQREEKRKAGTVKFIKYEHIHVSLRV